MSILILLCCIISIWFVFRSPRPWIKKQYFTQHKFSPTEIPSHILNEKVKISEWSIDKDPTPTDIASYSDRTFDGSLGKIFSYKLEDYNGKAYQWKNELSQDQPVDNWFLQRFRPITQQLHRLYGKANEVKLRISTNPWKFHSHFDCVNNYGVQIYGEKSILLWKRGDTEKDRALLSILKKTNNKLARGVLTKMGIPYKLWNTQPGDLFFIPQGWYHKIESINTGPGSILLNYNINPPSYLSNKCEKYFKQLWSKQTQKCRNNKCLD